MNPATTLAEAIARLQQAEIVPRPEGEEWSALVARISIPEQIAAIDDGSFPYCTSCHTLDRALLSYRQPSVEFSLAV